MEQKIKKMEKPSQTQEPEIIKSQEDVKAAHLSSNPMNEQDSEFGHSHFEVELHKAFFSVFFGC